MTRISGVEQFDDFPALREFVLRELPYPSPQTSKFETFGWVPCTFQQSERIFTRRNGSIRTISGDWRRGEAEIDLLSVFFADVDNADAGRPMVAPSDVARALSRLGIGSYFTYSTYSDTPDHPKFRLIVEIDRLITRAEAFDLFILLNKDVLDGQGDLSIYDPADFLFAPPFNHHQLSSDGARMQVDEMLQRSAQLRADQPGLWHVANPKAYTKRSITPDQIAAYTAKLARLGADLTVGSDVSANNPRYVNPQWIEDYKAEAAGSRWATMRSVMGKVWLRSGGSLTQGEMSMLFDGIDDTSGRRFLLKHGSEKKADIIRFVMSRPVPPEFEGSSEPQFRSILNAEDTGLVVDLIEAACGEGKTRNMLSQMSAQRGRYVYVCDKIDNMQKRQEEFGVIAGKGLVRFSIETAHSDKPFTVTHQLRLIRERMNRLPAGSAAIVFCTHAAAMMMDWTDWTDFEMVIDEVPEITSVFSINAQQNHHLLTQFLWAGDLDGQCYPLTTSRAGSDLSRAALKDDYHRLHHGLLVMLQKPNTRIWVREKGWDDPANHPLEFFGFSSPENLRHFRRVWLLGDEARKSLTARVWADRWGVRFEPHEFPRRRRAVPTSSRLTIYYFSEHRDASLSRFGMGDCPLEKISGWIAAHAGEPVLWTVNDRMKARVNLPQHDYASPKAHGRNDLMHYRQVAWLCAMKASPFEVTTLRDVLGITAHEISEWRELNAMYQFIMRGDLRRFDSAEQNVIYVFSRVQAEYLRERLGGVIRHVQGVVEFDVPVAPPPAKKAFAGTPMTNAEKTAASRWRKRMMEAGVEDIRELSGHEKLGARMVEIVNLTYKKKAA